VVTGTSGGEFFTAKYATNGVLLWEKRGPPGGAQAVAVDNHDNVVATGFSPYYYTAKYAAADGTLLWEHRDTHSLPDEGFNCRKESSLALDGDGNVLISAGCFGSPCDWTRSVCYVAKYGAADGALLWERSFVGTSPSMALDADGGVVVASVPDVSFENSHWSLTKYAQATER
jgi:hypothetical protein